MYYSAEDSFKVSFAHRVDHALVFPILRALCRLGCGGSSMRFLSFLPTAF